MFWDHWRTTEKLLYVGFEVLTAVLPPSFSLVSYSANSSTLKTKAICSFETSVKFPRTILRYIAEDSTIQIIVILQFSWAPKNPSAGAKLSAGFIEEQIRKKNICKPGVLLGSAMFHCCVCL
jgi:hypothetical protein